MGRHIADGFSPADARRTSIRAVCGIARRACRVSDQIAVDSDVVARHAAGGEAVLEATSYLATVHRDRLYEGNPRLMDVVDDQAGDAVLDDFGNRAGAIGEDGGAGGHRLNHHQPELLGPG